jgi:hypothetical protein
MISHRRGRVGTNRLMNCNNVASRIYSKIQIPLPNSAILCKIFDANVHLVFGNFKFPFPGHCVFVCLLIVTCMGFLVYVDFFDNLGYIEFLHWYSLAFVTKE